MSRQKSDRRYEALEHLTANPRLSMRELADLMGLRTTSSVWNYIHDLELEGLITRKPGQARGIFIGEHKWGDGAHFAQPKHLSARAEKVLEAVKGHPLAAMEELVRMTGMRSSVIYYHLNMICKKDAWAGAAEVLKRLKRQGEAKRGQGHGFERRQPVVRKSRVSEAERIQRVVENARNHLVVDCDFYVRPNGVKVVVQKAHWVGVGSKLE